MDLCRKRPAVITAAIGPKQGAAIQYRPGGPGGPVTRREGSCPLGPTAVPVIVLSPSGPAEPTPLNRTPNSSAGSAKPA